MVIKTTRIKYYVSVSNYFELTLYMTKTIGLWPIVLLSCKRVNDRKKKRQITQLYITSRVDKVVTADNTFVTPNYPN